MKNKKGNTILVGIIIFIVVISAGVIGWMFMKKLQSPKQPEAATQSVVSSEPITEIQPKDKAIDWQVYRNDEIGIELKYPANLSKINVEKGQDGKAIYINADFTRENLDETSATSFGFSAYANDYNSMVPGFSFEGNKDWKVTSACPKPLVYNINPIDINTYGNVCKIIDIAGEKAVWKNLIKPTDEGIPIAMTEILFNNKNSSVFKKLRFYMGYPEIEDELSEIWEGDPSKEDDYKKAELKASEYSKNIIERKDLPAITSENLNLLDKILSTFKFIEPAGVSTWKTYRNKYLDIAFDYPSTWNLSSEDIEYSKDVFSINFLTQHDNHISIQGNNNPSVEESSIGSHFGECAYLSKGIKDFCKDGRCINVNNKTAIRYESPMMGERVHMAYIYTSLSKKYPFLCTEVTMNEIYDLFDDDAEKYFSMDDGGMMYFDVPSYIKSGTTSERMKEYVSEINKFAASIRK